MKIISLIVFATIGVFIGVSLAILSQNGYLERWNKLVEPSKDILSNFSILNPNADYGHYGLMITRPDDPGTIFIKPCDYSSVEFSQFSYPPKDIKNCVQVKHQYAESARLETFVQDHTGNIWEWSFYVVPSLTNHWGFITYWGSLGVLIGIIVALFINKMRQARILNA